MGTNLYVVAGPSGVGKGTIVKKLCALYPEIFLSISMTTRKPREGEIDGVHYYFVDKSDFEKLIDDNKILEYAFVHGQNYYGTPLEPVKKALEQSRPCLLEIDLDGARQVKKLMKNDVVFVFIAPPNWEELEKRLKGRGTEDESNIAQRLKTAEVELKAQDEFDFVVVNDDLDVAVDKLARIMKL